MCEELTYLETLETRLASLLRQAGGTTLWAPLSRLRQEVEERIMATLLAVEQMREDEWAYLHEIKI